MSSAVQKYLERYAEPEAGLVGRLDGPYDSALVVPVLAESVDALGGFESAFRRVRGRGLIVLVVNATVDTGSREKRENQRLLANLAKRPGRRTIASAPPMGLTSYPDYDLLVVDRSSEGFQLGPKEGVGRARRIGCDIALALAERGVLSSRGVGCTDADARLPEDYFPAAERLLPGAGAVLFGFRHRPSGDGELDDATRAYELSLRYYVLGLARAGSPYAFHSVGSTLYLDLESYGKVRGFANRQAGEDFYLLDKIVKTAPLRRLVEPHIEIQTRLSSRVPFGTGPGVDRLLKQRARGDDFLLYAPRTFVALRAWLSTLDEFAKAPGLLPETGPLSCLEPRLARSVREHLEASGAWQRLELAAQSTRSPEPLRRRLHTWFDGLRTLKFVHALRDSGQEKVPFEQALAEAPFSLGTVRSIPDALERVTQAERRLPREVGLGPF